MGSILIHESIFQDRFSKCSNLSLSFSVVRKEKDRKVFCFRELVVISTVGQDLLFKICWKRSLFIVLFQKGAIHVFVPRDLENVLIGRKSNISPLSFTIEPGINPLSHDTCDLDPPPRNTTKRNPVQ